MMNSLYGRRHIPAGGRPAVSGAQPAVEDRLAGVEGNTQDRLTAAAVAVKSGEGQMDASDSESTSFGLHVLGSDSERVERMVTSVEKGGKVVQDTVVDVVNRLTRKKTKRKPKTRLHDARRLSRVEVEAMILRDAARGIPEAQANVFFVK